MAKINLLPWRAERRKLREREFYMMLGAAAIAAVLVAGLWWYWMGARLDNQDSRNAYMKDQIHQLDGKLREIKRLEETESKLLARKQIIEQLQANHSRRRAPEFIETSCGYPDSGRRGAIQRQRRDIYAQS